MDLPALLKRLEDAYIDEALVRAGGEKKAAAEMLGLNRTTLVEKLKRRMLDSPPEEEPRGSALPEGAAAQPLPDAGGQPVGAGAAQPGAALHRPDPVLAPVAPGPSAPVEPPITVGVRQLTISEARRSRGLNQTELAARVGTTQGTISAAERGRLSEGMRARIVLALEIRSDQLLPLGELVRLAKVVDDQEAA